MSEITVTREGRTLTVTGDLEYGTAARFAAEAAGVLAEAAGLSVGPLVVDLCGVEYMDSAGASALLDVRKRAPVRLIVSPGQPLKILRLSRLTTVFEIEERGQ